MKVDNTTNQKPLTPKEKQQQQIREKLRAKFGDKAMPKKIETKDKAEISVKAEKRAEKGDPDFADVGKNDPNSAATREKLKGLLKSGGFQFSDKERATLSEILK